MTKPTKELIIESPTHGQLKVLYDAEDEDKISKHTWSICNSKHSTTKTYRNTAYARTTRVHPKPSNGEWYVSPKGLRYRRRQTVYIHRLILEDQLKNNTHLLVDHINGNGLDNRKCNLRICTAQENRRNSKADRNNKTGFKGVIYRLSLYNNKKKPYVANIYFDKKQKHIGYYPTAEEAARAYDAKAKELYGKFAHLNFPDE